MIKPLQLLFAGTPEFASTVLAALIESRHRVRAVLTQPDRPAGRGRKPTPSAVKRLALEHGIEVMQPPTLRDAEIQARLAAFHVDLMVVVAYGLILPEAVLSIPRLGCINVHASLLPRWRGAAPIQRALLAGDRETGITIMQMDAGLDTGDSILQVGCEISAHDTAGTLHDRLATLAARALLEALERLEAGAVTHTAQDSRLATYADKVTKEEARLDWTLSSSQLERRIRAFNPWPVAYTYTKSGQVMIRVWGARTSASIADAPPGTVLAAGPEGIAVQTGDGVLLITELQLAGGRTMHAADFLNARSELVTPGTQLL